MKNYKAITIEEAMSNITNNKYCLPIIQRGYVWEPKKIELLFDSIMRGYPIGTFLFWTLNNKIIRNIQFYEFIKYGSENILSADKKNKINGKTHNDLIGILDGQQRLTSLYIGIHSNYIIHKQGTKKENGENEIEKYLYLDLTNINKPEEDELLNVTKKVYDFRFLSIEEAQKDKKWFKVGDITYNKSIINEIKKAYPHKKDIIEKNYNRLRHIIKYEKAIQIINLKNQKINEVLEIFERTNSFGKSLKKTDLIFSTIVSHWDEGYDAINKLLKIINNKPSLYGKFDINYIVLSSLVLIGESPKIKISSLNKKTIEIIKEEWPDIEKSIIKSADIVSKLNLFPSTIKSTNAIIPISYYYKENPQYLYKYKKNIRRYLQLSAIKGIYGVHADTTLTDMQKAIKNKEIKTWDINELYNIKIDNEYSFIVNEEDINRLLDYDKGDYSLLTLSILYEDKIHIIENDYEQDHMHPKTPFKKEITINFPKLSEDKQKNLIKLNNKVPNLQLLTKDENESKSETPLKQYLKNKKKINSLKKKHYIPECSYDVKDFENFYEKRRTLLKKRLMEIFKVKKNKNSNIKN